MKIRPTDTDTTPQRRMVTFDNLELRKSPRGGDTLTLEGYASVFGHEYEVAGGPPYGWVESIEPDAFDETLSEDPDVVLLVNHDGLPLARTKSGTLELFTDSTGLGVRADLDASDPDVQQIQPKMERGDLDEMSFAFRVERQEWDETYERRWIKQVNINRGDVSVVTYGANDATEVDLRALLAEAGPEALAELRSQGVTAEMLSAAANKIEALSGTEEAPNDGKSGQGGTPWLSEAKQTLRRHQLAALSQ